MELEHTRETRDFKVYSKKVDAIFDLEYIHIFNGQVMFKIKSNGFLSHHEIELLDYIGSKDIKGNKIFEGDILEKDDKIVIVPFKLDWRERFVGKPFEEYIAYLTSEFRFKIETYIKDIETYKIIGNTFYNHDR